MKFHSVHADVKLPRYFEVRLALRSHREHLCLARRQTLDPVRGYASRLFDHGLMLGSARQRAYGPYAQRRMDQPSRVARAPGCTPSVWPLAHKDRGAYRRSVSSAFDRGHACASVDVLLVCSAGGHLLQLHLLSSAWAERPRVWITHDKDDARSLLAGEEVIFAHGPTTRNIKNLVLNLLLAWRTIRLLSPQLVITTGAGVAVPFAWVARVLGARVIYIESLTRIDAPSLSCRLISPLAERTYVQWPELAPKVPRGRYLGQVMTLR